METSRLSEKTRQLRAIIEREEDGYVRLCPERDFAGQGDSLLSIIGHSHRTGSLSEV